MPLRAVGSREPEIPVGGVARPALVLEHEGDEHKEMGELAAA